MSEIENEKKEKRRVYMKEYNRKKREKETQQSENIIIPNIIISNIDVPVKIVKHLLIKPDISLLLKHNRLYRRTMSELIKRTTFLQWSKQNNYVIQEFNTKKIIYNEYHEKIEKYRTLFSIMARKITLEFIEWFELFENVMDEFQENQL